MFSLVQVVYDQKSVSAIVYPPHIRLKRLYLHGMAHLSQWLSFLAA